MTEIAEAAGMSRPALYASFPNRLAIFDTLTREHARLHAESSADVMRSDFSARGRLNKLYDVWFFHYFEGMDAMDYERFNALTLQCNIFAPAASNFYWDTFAEQIAEAISLWPSRSTKLTPSILASIVVAATRDFKIHAPTKESLRVQVEGLIEMALGVLHIPL